MALTVKNVNTLSEDTFGRHRVRFVDVTFDASYDAGGELLTAAACALAEIVGATVVGNSSGYVVAYNPATKKLVVRGTEPTSAAAGVIQAPEVAAATDLSAVKVRLQVIGH